MGQLELAEDPLPDDNHRAKRSAQNMRATIKVGSTRVIDCIVKEISSQGAELIILPGSWLPSTFSLEVNDGSPPYVVNRATQTKDGLSVRFRNHG
jgi:hypothetical protein